MICGRSSSNFLVSLYLCSVALMRQWQGFLISALCKTCSSNVGEQSRHCPCLPIPYMRPSSILVHPNAYKWGPGDLPNIGVMPKQPKRSPSNRIVLYLSFVMPRLASSKKSWVASSYDLVFLSSKYSQLPYQKPLCQGYISWPTWWD